MLKKIIFMGTPLFAVPILKSLYQNGYPISIVYTQPPQKSNRGMEVKKSAIQGLSETLNLEFRIPSSLKNNKEEYNFIKKLEADIGIVVAYGQLLPKEILDLPKKGFINIHASLLPLWRGAAPIERCLMNRDKETGISFMKIAEKLDSGPISNTYSLNILENENAQSLSERLSLLAAEKILNEIDLVLENKAIFKSQEEKKASYAKKISKSEGKIDWNNLAESIIGKINGLYPNPGAWFSFNGQRYKVLEAKIGNKSGNSGVVLDDNLEIGCRDKSIQIITIQREGRTPKKAKEFMLGSSITKGSNLNNA
tara:strand:+ start:82 stop:1011 length:930 start_codon:yes stop_codon:yes gene_type:complete